jgi:hypothetical protein
MGATQITIGVGFLLTAHVFPALRSHFVRVPSGAGGSLVLPESRGMTTR